MLNTIKNLAIVALLATGSAAWAQETTSEDVTPDAGLDLGTPVDATPVVGQAYLRETSGDWAIRCLRAEEGQEDPCQLYQLLNDDQGNSVAEFSMFPLADGGRAVAGATIVAPLETLLTEQLTITVDGGDARRYGFTFCNAGGCVARVGFTAEEIAQFKRGNGAMLRLVPAGAPDQEILLTLSLTGFTAAFDGAKESLTAQ